MNTTRVDLLLDPTETSFHPTVFLSSIYFLFHNKYEPISSTLLFLLFSKSTENFLNFRILFSQRDLGQIKEESVYIMDKSFAVCEEMMSSVAISDKKERDCLVCPKPRRLSQLNYTVNDSKAGLELLDMIFSKGGQDTEYSNHIPSSPPFFCGSPPSRATNPVVQDAHFGDRKVNSSSPLSNMSLSPTSLTWKGGCARTKFGQKPAAVRVEGFDCLNKDRRSCNISAVA